MAFAQINEKERRQLTGTEDQCVIRAFQTGFESTVAKIAPPSLWVLSVKKNGAHLQMVTRPDGMIGGSDKQRLPPPGLT